MLVIVARLFRGGDLSIIGKQTLASEEASYKNYLESLLFIDMIPTITLQ
jgi:hypothetical protein